MVFIDAVRYPDEISLSAEQNDAGRVVVKVDYFTAEADLGETEGFDPSEGPPGNYIDDDNELWLWIRQGDIEDKIGEVDLDGIGLNDLPTTVTLRVETDSSQIVNSDYLDPGGIVPGGAELFISGRTGEDPGFTEPVTITADFPTPQDITIQNARASKAGGDPGEVEGIDVTFDTVSKVPFGVPAMVRATVEGPDGELLKQAERSLTIPGSLSLGEKNVEEATVNVPLLEDTPGEYRCCVGFVTLDGERQKVGSEKGPAY